MEYSIYELETDAANYRLDSSDGEPRIRILEFVDGRGQDMILSVKQWEKIQEELPEVIKILTGGPYITSYELRKRSKAND